MTRIQKLLMISQGGGCGAIFLKTNCPFLIRASQMCTYQCYDSSQERAREELSKYSEEEIFEEVL